MASNFDFLTQALGLVGAGAAPPPPGNKPAPAPTPAPAPAPAPSNGSRGDRNGNQGNIKDGPFARSQPGYVGNDGKGMAVFKPGSSAGTDAQLKLLGGKAYSGRSISGIIQKYAPLGPENSEASVRNYIGYVSSRAGIDPDKPVTPQQLATVAAAMREFETGNRGGGGFKPYGGSISGMSAGGTGNPQGGFGPGGSAVGPSEIAGRTALNPGAGQDTSSTPIVNPFDPAVIADAKSREGQVQSDVNATFALIDKNKQVIDTVQNERMTALQLAVKAKGDALAGVQDQNRQLVQNISPLLAKRNQVDQRLAELATMNPLERGFKGIFDLNYNDKYLKRVSDQLGSAVKDQAENYSIVQTLQDQFIKNIDAQYDNGDEVHKLLLVNADQDAAILGQHLQTASMNLDLFNKNLDVQRNIISSQQIAKADAMESLTPQDKIAMLAKAKADPTNSVTVNGIPIGQAELATAVSRDQAQELDIQSANMAYQSNQMQLADKYAERLAGTMTLPQLQAAQANGGVYRGVRIPNAVITQNLAALTQADAINADTQMAQAQTGQTAYLLNQIAENSRAFANKAQPLGILKGAPYQAISTLQGQANTLSQQYIAAQKRGDTQTMKAVTAELSGINTQMTATITGVAKSITGDDKAAASLSAYWLNQPVSSDTALDTMMGFVNKGGLPIAMRASPTFSAAYASTKQAMDSVDKAAAAKFGGITSPEYQRWLKSPDRRAAIAESVQTTAPKAINQSNFDAFNERLPAIAKANNAKFGAVSQREWEMANTQSTIDMYTQAGKKLGITPGEAQGYFEKGITPQSLAGQNKATVANFKTMIGEVQKQMPIWQRSSLLHHLDQLPEANQNFRPSQAYVDFISSPEYLNSISKFEGTQGQFSYGDYVSGAMRGQGVVPLAKSYGDSMKMQWTQNQIEAISGSQKMRNSYNNIPGVRLRTTLGAMEGLSESDESTLVRVIAKNFPSLDTPVNASDTNDKIRSFLMNNKFPDPGLEAIRRKVIKQYDPTQQMLDKAIDRMQLDSTTKGAIESRGPLGILG